MPRLERKTQQIFCNSADSDQLAVFGSMATGTPVYSNDIEELQSNEAYQVGWDAATLEDKAPFMEEMNGLQYGITRQLAYLLQQGISEWDAGTTYYIGNFVAQNSRLYISLTDNNIGNSPIDSADNWQEFSSGGGVHKMFDPVLQDHILSFEQSKGFALQGTYVYKDAIAGSRYGYSTFYNKCVQEFQNASNTQVYLSSNVNLVGSLVDTKGVLSGFSTAKYATLPNAFAPSASDTWEANINFTTGSNITTAQYFMNSYYGVAVYITAASALTVALGAGSSFNILAATNIGTVTANTEYNVKISFNGTQYTIELNGAVVKTVASTTQIGGNTLYLGIQNTLANPLTYGTIDLNESYININGSRWWSGVDTVTRNPNGHLFYDINDKSIIDEYYIANGRAWMYGVDVENERIFLPRNSKYFRIGDESTVGTNQDAGLPNITGRFGGGLSTVNSIYQGAFYNGAAYSGTAANAGGESDEYAYFDASRSSAIYGNSDTVELDSVNMLLYICVGNTESEEALTDVIDVTTTENDTIPLFTAQYFDFKPNNISWLKAGVQKQSGGIYTFCYNELVKCLNEVGNIYNLKVINEVDMIAGVDYSEYWKVNQENMTFTTPTKANWNVLNSDSKVNLKIKTPIAETVTGAPNSTHILLQYQGDVYSGTEAHPLKVSAVGRMFSDDANDASVFPDVTGYTYGVAEQSTAQLYFKVANAVQNLELLNAGEVLEAVNDINAKVDNTVHITETYRNGDSWYRIYSDGWCEQGGATVASGSAETTVTVSLLKQFPTTDYHVFGSYQASSLNMYGQCYNLTTSGFTQRTYGGKRCSWFACGYIA